MRQRPAHASLVQVPLAVAFTEDDPDRVPLRVFLRLASCRNLLMRQARQHVERWNLTLPQFDVLAELARAPKRGFTFIELSRLLLVTSGNLTGIVDRLEHEHLVCREDDGNDRRVIRVRLTAKGRRLTDEMLPEYAQEVQRMLADLSPRMLCQLAEHLGTLRKYLHDQAERAPRRR